MIDKALRGQQIVYRGVYYPASSTGSAVTRVEELRVWNDLPAPRRKQNGEITVHSLRERFSVSPIGRNHQNHMIQRGDACTTRAEAVAQIIAKIDRNAERDRQQARNLLTQKGQ